MVYFISNYRTHKVHILNKRFKWVLFNYFDSMLLSSLEFLCFLNSLVQTIFIINLENKKMLSEILSKKLDF